MTGLYRMPGVFISYRREGGSDFSRIIETFLSAAGLDVFLDVDSLEGGQFDEQLLRHIEVRDVVILICSPGCFDRCDRPGDWVKRELEHAITLKKRIVPVMIENFAWPRPEELPESIREVARYNAFEYSHTHWKETRKRLLNLIGVLTGEERSTPIRRAESPGLDGGEFGLVPDARMHASGARRAPSAPPPNQASSAGGTCPTCGAGNDADVKFCGSCGAGLFETCPRCKRENRIGRRFCGGCGVEIDVARNEGQAKESGREEESRRAEAASPVRRSKWSKQFAEFAPKGRMQLPLSGDTKLTLCWVKPGQFMMGSPMNEPGRRDRETQHVVTISEGFWLGQSPVTQTQWQAVMGTNPSQFDGDRNRPVESVSWNDAQEFLRTLNDKFPGLDLRLPTEAEWEYACRAGTATAYSFGVDPSRLGDYAWFKDNSSDSTHPVAIKQPNAWGLHDMHGNVLEWCSDRWSGDYPSGAVTDPQGPVSGSLRVLRGGSWRGVSQYCRAATRDCDEPNKRISCVGFRVARTP